MKELHFESVEHFSDHIKELSMQIIKAGFQDLGRELDIRATAYEVPMTGYYSEIYLLLKSALSNREFSLNEEIHQKTLEAYNACNKILNGEA
jgi:hypothetical protein